MSKPHPLAVIVLCAAAALIAADSRDHFEFAILGDRTGDVQGGVYEQVWSETAAENPAFVINSGDTIEGGNDKTAEAEWQQAKQLWKPYRRLAFYLIPGNHDIWSSASEQLFRKFAGRPPHYSFDYGDAHFTVLDNSLSDGLAPSEIEFLEQDLKAHAKAPVKMILSHRPSWLIPVALKNPDFPLHRLAKQYGVEYVVAGHVHQMLHFELEGVTYISMPSSGGHLRLTKKYEDGWFFGHARVEVTGRKIDFHLEELRDPKGQGRITKAAEWGAAGLIQRPAASTGRGRFLVGGNPGQIAEQGSRAVDQ